ncbi:MAG: (2Fe-2S)-binding protein [Dehalococcoidia bacterium]
MAERRALRMTVNGTEYEGLVEPRKSLADFLRIDLGFTGTHLGCEHGVCGACTILFNGAAVRSCLLFAVQADGAEIMTVEGLATGEQLHPIQEAFWENHGLQCGFCTPGFIMSIYAFLRDNPNPSDKEIRVGLSGNLCRCTGYHDIVSSVKAAITKLESTGG